MVDIHSVLSSKGSVGVARVLIEAGSNGVSLREIAYRGELGIRSVQIVVRRLLRDGVLLRRRERNRTLLAFKELPIIADLKKFYLSDTERRIGLRAAACSDQASKILEQIGELSRLILAARADYSKRVEQ